ncbi:MAG TPA: hypothetical protein VGB87_00225 [Vicinamibacteria bacterium]
MPTPFLLALGLAVLGGLGVLAVLGRRVARALLTYRGTRPVVCPETGEVAGIQVDAAHAALSASRGRPQLHLVLCTRWPERAGCGQECLGQIASAPEGCLLRNILGYWYQGKSCAYCGRSFRATRWHEQEPGLVTPDGALVAWDTVRAEQALEVLATHKPVCWDCRVAEGLRRGHSSSPTTRRSRA